MARPKAIANILMSSYAFGRGLASEAPQQPFKASVGGGHCHNMQRHQSTLINIDQH
jgi:hypothetical protein